jgi:hypothetical protein
MDFLRHLPGARAPRAVARLRVEVEMTGAGWHA